MRTNIVIDDHLMNRVKIVTGIKTKKETIETALKLLLRINNQAKIKNSKGKMMWEGDLEKMRIDR
jgi:Arc/MetJ family transcription regulator